MGPNGAQSGDTDPFAINLFFSFKQSIMILLQISALCFLKKIDT